MTVTTDDSEKVLSADGLGSRTVECPKFAADHRVFPSSEMNAGPVPAVDFRLQRRCQVCSDGKQRENGAVVACVSANCHTVGENAHLRDDLSRNTCRTG